MLRSRRRQRLSSGSGSDSSSSTSPERGVDDDNDSFTLVGNDSQSSLTASVGPVSENDETVSDLAERRRLSPMSCLPAEILIAIFARLASIADLFHCMLVCRNWARNSVALLWHRPHTNTWSSLHNVATSVRTANGFFAYHDLIKRLNLSNLGVQASNGTLLPFSNCKRIERLTLTNCGNVGDLSLVQMLNGNKSLLALDVTGLEHLTDSSLFSVADNCSRLQGLNISNCKKISDTSLCEVARKCKHLKRLKFNGCLQITDKAILAIAENCHHLLEIDVHDCKVLEDESITALIREGRHLRELRLAHCSRITDTAFLRLPPNAMYESLRILDLTDCGEIQDSGIQKIVTAAPRLRNLVLAKCRQLTDRAVQAITRLGKNLHYIHLGHCSRITDAGVQQLVKFCNRIRYIDLACCQRLTDTSVHQLSTLPKLKRIGLVKCGNITDRSILALAEPKPAGQGGSLSLSSLERVHLSYCTSLTLDGIHALLNSCPRLTHLSLTGVQAFLREDLVVFCREAPPEFNNHQRNVFCVFSGAGIGRLREYLNQVPVHRPYEDNYTMYNEDRDENDVTEDNVSTDTLMNDENTAQQQVTGVTGLMGATAIEETDEDLGDDSEVTIQD